MKKILSIVAIIVLIVILSIICFFIGAEYGKFKTTEVEAKKLEESKKVIIQNGIIENEELINEFIETSRNKVANKLEIKASEDVVVEYSNIAEGESKYIIYENGKYVSEYDDNIWDIKRRINDIGNIEVFFDSEENYDLVQNMIICEYSFSSSNYTRNLEFEYLREKNLGLEVLIDNKEYTKYPYSIKIIGGYMNIVVEQDMVITNLKNAILENIIEFEDIMKQIELDAKYGFITVDKERTKDAIIYTYDSFEAIKYENETLDLIVSPKF